MITWDQDSDGNSYQIWKQDQPNSCGVASSWMCRNMVRQQTSGESEWSLAISIFRSAVDTMMRPLGLDPDGPMCFVPGAIAANENTLASRLSTAGFMPQVLMQAFQAQHINVTARNRASRQNMTLDVARLSDSSPALVGVYWRGGGHAVVAVRQSSSGRVVFIDPWDGKVNELRNNGVYNARYNSVGDIGVALYLSA